MNSLYNIEKKNDFLFAGTVWLYGGVLAILILFGTRIPMLTVGALIVGIAAIILLDEQRTICLLFFLLPFATIFKLGSGTSFFTYWELFFSVFVLIRRKFKATFEQINIILFIMFLIINQCVHGMFNATTTLKFFSYLILVVAIVNIKFQDENKLVFLCYINGFILSSFASLFDKSIFYVSRFTKMKQERVNGEYITRFSGLYSDPNYYVVNLIIAMVLVIILYRKKKLSIFQTTVLMIPLIYFTAKTGSKSGLFMLLVVAGFFLYQCFAKKHYFIGGISCILAVLMCMMVFSGKIAIFSNVLVRLTASSTSLTSGRADTKWAVYLKYFNENPARLVLGRSIAYFDLNGVVAHNTYIDLLYELGLIGTGWLIIILKKAHNRVTLTKKSFLNYSVLIVVLLMYFFLSELQYFDPVFHIALVILTMNMEMNITPKMNCISDAELIRKNNNNSGGIVLK